MIFSDQPFSKLRDVLMELGFEERPIEGKYLGYFHRASDTLFTFRKYNLQDKVSMADLIMVRKQLDWRGLLNQETFDATLSKVSA